MGLSGRRRLGRSGVEVTALGLGCAPLGNLYAPVTDDEATATVQAAWDAGIRLFDTAPLYGSGLSERRLGASLAGLPRDQVVVSTKVGRVLEPGAADPIFVDVPALAPTFDFSADGVRRSLDASLERLGLDRVDVALVHDPDDHEAEAMTGAFPALLRLRDEGVVGAVGCGMNTPAMPARFVDRVDLDCVLLAGRVTLLDRSGDDELLPRCVERGVAVLAAGVFNSGLLVDPRPGAPYDYAPAPPEVVAKAQSLAEVCARHGVPLAAAALQRPAAAPAVASVVVGARSAAEVAKDVRLAVLEVPAALWDDLRAEGLLDPDLAVPDGGGRR